MITQLLEGTSPDLLRRTGVDILLLNVSRPSRCRNHLLHLVSETSPTFLHGSSNLDFICSAISARVRLATEGSKYRFEQLCSFLRHSIIGNIWVYGWRDQDTLQASAEVIPNIVRVLVKGTSRCLKVRIPRVVDAYRPREAHDLAGLSSSTDLPPRARSRQQEFYPVQAGISLCAQRRDPRLHSPNREMEGHHFHRDPKMLDGSRRPGYTR